MASFFVFGSLPIGWKARPACLFTVKSQSRFPALLVHLGLSFTVRVDRSRRDVRSAQLRWLKTVLFF